MLETSHRCNKRVNIRAYLFVYFMIACTFCSATTLFGLDVHVKSLLNVQDKSIEIILTTHDCVVMA